MLFLMKIVKFSTSIIGILKAATQEARKEGRKLLSLGVVLEGPSFMSKVVTLIGLFFN